MDEPNVKTLNELLRGEHMAIQAYESIMPALTENTRKQLKDMLQITRTMPLSWLIESPH